MAKQLKTLKRKHAQPLARSKAQEQGLCFHIAVLFHADLDEYLKSPILVNQIHLQMQIFLTRCCQRVKMRGLISRSPCVHPLYVFSNVCITH